MKLSKQYSFVEENSTDFIVARTVEYKETKLIESIHAELKEGRYNLTYGAAQTGQEGINLKRTANDTDNHWLKQFLKNLCRDAHDYEEQMRWVESLWHAGRDVFVDPFGSYAEKENVKA